MVVIVKEAENPVIEGVQRQSEKFDGLANDYDRYRPRYPLTLFKTMLHSFKNKKHLSIVDVGAGTGIALEGIVKFLGNEHQYHAIDVSADMIKQGQKKFPTVQWYQGRAEDLLPQIGEVDLVIAAQAFQWIWIVPSCFVLFQINFESMVSWRLFKIIAISSIANF